MSEADAIARFEASGRKPATVVSLVEDLRSLGVRSGSMIMVHASLSALG